MGCIGWATKKNELFLKVDKKISTKNVTTKLEGGMGMDNQLRLNACMLAPALILQALLVGPLTFFCGFPNMNETLIPIYSQMFIRKL